MNYIHLMLKIFLDLDLFFLYIYKNIFPKQKYWNEEQNELQEKKNIIYLENLILEYNKNKNIFGKIIIIEKKEMQLRSEFIALIPSNELIKTILVDLFNVPMEKLKMMN